ncbi:MAG: phosphotransferase [Defluviitaleaceae bacterium]|nr:phosphotransferase [Defluviitaleaceae bacterium]
MRLSQVIAERPNKTIYRDGDYVIKLMDEKYTAANVLNEALNHAIVYETGFKVPRFHEVVKLEGRWAIVMDYIEGRTLDSIMLDDPANIDSYMERFVDLQIKMHGYKAESLRHHTDKMHSKIRETSFDATAKYELHSRLDGLPKNDKLCHGDYTTGNVIITSEDEAYVIDWSHATQGNGSADAARTYLRYMLAKKEDWAEIYLKKYCKKSDTARQYVEKWMAIVAASQSVKRKPEEQEFLLRWANIVEYS